MIMLHQGGIIAQGTPDYFQHTDDPLIRQFVEGLADGPVPFRLSAGNYYEDLLKLK